MTNDTRSGLLASLSPGMISRISVALGGGVGIAAAATQWNGGGLSNISFAAISLGIAGLAAFSVMKKSFQRLVVITQGSSPLRALWRALVRHFLRVFMRHPLITLLIISFVCTAFIAALPAVPILVFGIWACLLTQQRADWIRYVTDALVAILTGLGLLVLFDHNLPVTQPALSLLFPVGVWLSIRAWRVMAGSRRFAVRAGADIALSLLLGANFALFLIWGANLLDLPKSEVAALRSTLEYVGSIADLPWPLWVGLYVLLAGTSLALALWPDSLAPITRWLTRFHGVPFIDASRRILTGVHLSLLLTALIGLTAPASLDVALRSPLKVKYTVTLQHELESQGKQAAYDEISRQFTENASTSPSGQLLAAIVSKIHNISSPPPGASDATSTERDLARRLGQTQATTLQLADTQSVLSMPQAVTDLARFDPPIRNVGDLNNRLDQLDTQQRRADTETRLVNQAAELAATAVANMIQIPGLGENEIIQIIREYLSGLVESSPLKEVFAAGAKRLTGGTALPHGDKMVIPDPEKLKQAAFSALTQEQGKVQLADPSTPDQARTRTETEPAADAAVDLVNETRYLDEHTGPCDGCPQPQRPPGEEHYHGPGDYPVRPAEPVEPRIRIFIPIANVSIQLRAPAKSQDHS